MWAVFFSCSSLNFLRWGSLIKLEAYWFKRLASHPVPGVLLSLPPNTRIIELCQDVWLFTRALRVQTHVLCLHNKHFTDIAIFQAPVIYFKWPLLYISRTVCLALCVWTGAWGLWGLVSRSVQVYHQGSYWYEQTKKFSMEILGFPCNLIFKRWDICTHFNLKYTEAFMER